MPGKQRFAGALKSNKVREHAQYFRFSHRERENRGLLGGGKWIRTLGTGVLNWQTTAFRAAFATMQRFLVAAPQKHLKAVTGEVCLIPRA
jgi:hypothetical protein